jgi:hypothetical protein
MLSTRVLLILPALVACSSNADVGAPDAGSAPSVEAADVALAQQDPCEPAGATAALIQDCPDWGCGTNSPDMGDGIVFHELKADAVNSGGVKLHDFRTHEGVSLQLRVDGDELLGIDARGRVYRADDLKWAIMTLKSSDGTTFHVRAEKAERIPFWVGAGRVPTWEFRVRKSGDTGKPFEPLCRGLHVGREWSNPRSAIVFTGDRYRAASKTVIAPSEGWFNIACAGTAIAKLHLLRHTAASGDAGHQTTRAQRQALLKLLAADYCGAGRSYTVDGLRLDMTVAPWRGAFSSIDLSDPAEVGRVEAIFDAGGAVCLNRPRRCGRRVIEAECSLPACPADLSSWLRRDATGTDGIGYALAARPQ